MQLTKNFNSSEFKCPCCGEAFMQMRFVEILQEIRSKLKKPMPIESGYRCPSRNKAVGGKVSSRHLKGLAADIKVATTEDRYLVVELAMRFGLSGIGINRTTVHLDMRTTGKRMWAYY